MIDHMNNQMTDGLIANYDGDEQTKPNIESEK